MIRGTCSTEGVSSVSDGILLNDVKMFALMKTNYRRLQARGPKSVQLHIKRHIHGCEPWLEDPILILNARREVLRRNDRV